MSEFCPTLSTRLVIQNTSYAFLPHPILPGEVQKIVREQATTYQLLRQPDQSLWALKVSGPGYRTPQAEQQTELLSRYHALPGLRVANRLCLTRSRFPELLATYPDLEYAVLMPWVQGKTWAGFLDDPALSVSYTQEQAQELALTMASILWHLETHHVTHTDIAGDNVMLLNPKRVELIDLEGLYIWGSPLPAQPGRGWRGYQHPHLDQRGHCRPEGDRFAGAILLTEMLTWWKPLVRALTEGESLFQSFQLSNQNPTKPLKRLLKVVHDTLAEINPGLKQLFDRAWFSTSLEECPDFTTWVLCLLQARMMNS